ncbi:MAG: hypothetical protein J7J86_07725 [Bacteroidales bacterium]|nr:hypothetical protein [Bacteroidales bacterium]
MKKLLIFVLVISSLTIAQAQSDLSIMDKLRLSGYFENEIMGQEQRGDYFLIDYNKLRIDLNAKIDEHFSFSGNVNFKTYHGKTELNILDYLPESTVNDYYNFLGTNAGLTPGEIRPQFEYNMLNDIFLDNAYVSYYSKILNVRVGKQQLPWGTGYMWNPTNIFHKKDMLDPTYEQVGVNAVKVEMPFKGEGMLTGIISTNDKFNNSTYALKVKKYLTGFDVSLSYVYYEYSTTDFYTFSELKENRQQIGGDFSGSIGGVGVYGEAVYRMKTGKNGAANYGNYVFGLNYFFENGLYLMGEYYYNEKGKDDYKKYNINDWMNYMGKYAENLGQHYVFAGSRLPIGNYLNFSTFFLYNISDNSGMFYPWIEYSLGDNTELMGTVYIPFGESVNTEFAGYGLGAMARIRVYF